jgi:hypothetical protein
MRHRLVLLVAGTGAYVLAAWSTPPGFYDGWPAPNPYRWISPPPSLAQGNQKPAALVRSLNTSELSSGSNVQTSDAQVSVYLGPGAVKPASGASMVTIRIEPVAEHPALGQLVAETNVYRIALDGVLSNSASVALLYSNQVPSPSTIYEQPENTSSWQALDTKAYGVAYQLVADVHVFGYFVGAIPANQFGQASTAHFFGQAIPWIVAGLIVIALVASIPLGLWGKPQPVRQPAKRQSAAPKPRSRRKRGGG